MFSKYDITLVFVKGFSLIYNSQDLSEKSYRKGKNTFQIVQAQHNVLFFKFLHELRLHLSFHINSLVPKDVQYPRSYTVLSMSYIPISVLAAMRVGV